MSTGLIVNPNNVVKAKPPIKVIVSDGNIGFPYGHPEFYSRNQPDGMLLLDLQNNEASEFSLHSDRDCDVSLYNFLNGSRFKLYVYRTVETPINITFNNKNLTYVVPGTTDTERLVILDVEVIELKGSIICKIGANSEQIEEVLSSLNTGSIRVSEDIQFNGVSQGSYADGSIIEKNTTLTEVLKKFVQKALAVTYTQPSLTIAPTNSSLEAGSFVSPTIVPTFQQRDGGALTSYVLKHNGNTILSKTALETFAFPNTQLADGASIVIQATASYEEGLTKSDNMGVPQPTGKVMAGSKTASLTYTGIRLAFYAADTATATPLNSADVRGLALNRLNPINGTSFLINIAPGTKRIVIAYPGTLRNINSIKYVELGNAEVKDTFVLSNVNVEGLNGFTAIGYKVYVYTPSVPFNAAATYNVTI